MAHPARDPSALLVLEDGSVFEGRAVAPGTRFGEVVFNTSMTGYQEVITDPSYRGQIVVMTQPHIGNYGVSRRAEESSRPWAEGFVVRKLTRVPSGEPSERELGGLSSYLRGHGIPAVEGIDTRALVRRLRDRGALRGVLTTERSDVDALAAEVADFPPMTGRALVDDVTCREPYELPAEAPAGETVEPRFHLAVYDYGAKRNILRSLAGRGARLTVLPARTPAAECLALGVDGVVLSNGPGDPEPLTEIVGEVADLIRSDRPVFGICLGHQLLALALGARTFKLKFGHHGGNQPVRELATGAVAITSQNHGFAVDPESLPREARATHVNLNDGTLEGLELVDRAVFATQYHPEAAPGPHEGRALFDRFLASLGETGSKRAPGSGAGSSGVSRP